MMTKRYFRTTLMLMLLVTMAIITLTTTRSAPPAALDVHGVLVQSWGFYKSRFMVNGERVQSNNYGGTISEGQSYALMKAVWMNDPQTFEKVWRWTWQNMKRPDDNLLGWRWGKTSSGQWGLISTENATDADQDIAYALLLASEKWNRPDYSQAARLMIEDLWRLNVQELHGHYYLTPGTWQGFRDQYLTLDPSYFAPYVYRRFAQADSNHASGWNQLARDSYTTLEACSNLTANKLPPNWCAVGYEDNRITFSDRQGPGSRDFSYDAFRVFWRMSMDARLGSPEARRYLEKHTALREYWNASHTLPEGFSADGEPSKKSPSGFALSAALAQAGVLSPEQRQSLYQAMLQLHYHAEGYWFNDHNDFLHSVIWLHLHTLDMSDSPLPKPKR